MRKFILLRPCKRMPVLLVFLLLSQLSASLAQTLSFPGATGFGRYAKGARGVANPQVYIVTTLADSGPGSFRDAVSMPGRFVVFAVGGIVNLASDIVVAPNTTVAGQTAPGDGIVFAGKRVTFTGSSNTICRYLRIRLREAGNRGKDASGLANGSNMIFDHMSFTWGMDEVFSINWDNKGTAPDSITVQNSIIGQGLHRDNHSAGGLIQTPDGGKVSLIRNLYISNKTRNPKVKGVNEFVNNVVYDWGNGNRLGDIMNYGWSGEGYIMGGSSGVSEVNIINNYFMGGPLTPPNESTPFSRGTGTFFLYGAGNYFDNNKNGVMDGALVPYDTTGYPGIAAAGFKTQPFPYHQANPAMTAAQAYTWVIDSVGAGYPRRDQVDALLADEVRSRGTEGFYVYRETDLPFSNDGVGDVFGAPAPADSDQDGMPDIYEDANGLNRNNAQDALAFSTVQPAYLNIEVYINGLINTTPPAFIKPPSDLLLTVSGEVVTLNWNDNSDDEDYFIVERSLDGINFSTLGQVTGNSYADSTLPNTLYYYRLKAVNNTGASVYTSPASVRTPPLPSAPPLPFAPNPANGFQYAETPVVLKWSGTDTFYVYAGTDPGNLTLRTVTLTPQFAFTGLTDFVTYYWRVDAKNSLGTTVGDLWSFRTTKPFPKTIVGSWSFDETEGRQVTDSSEYQNHGVLGLDDDDQSIRIPGKLNNALDFTTADPNRYVVSIPHQDQLYLDKGSFSLSFWMKANAALLPPDNNSSAYLLCKGSISRNATTGATGKRFDIEFKNKQLRFAIDDDNDGGGGGKDELQADGVPFFSGQWVHVTAIRDTTVKKLRLFMNGALVKETGIARANAGIGETSDLIIGNIGELEFLSTANKPAPYKGQLDELKIFNYALTDEQILGLFHTSPLPLQPYNPSLANGAMLEGYGDSVRLGWKGGLKTNYYKLYIGLDSANLSFVQDMTASSYYLHHLSAKTNYYWRVDAVGDAGTTAGPIWSFRAVSPKMLAGHWTFDDSSNVQGKIGGAFQFANSGITVPHREDLQFDANSFTISMWVKLNSSYNASAGADCYLIHKGQFTDPGGKWYGIQLKDSILTFAIDDATAKTNVDVSLKKASAYYIFNNTWSHIMAVKDTSLRLIRLYVNGVLAGSKAYTTTGTTGKAVPLIIGSSPENKPFHDAMDDLRLYNYVLSQGEIDSLLCKVPLPSFNAGADKTIYLGYGPQQVTLSAPLPVTWSLNDSLITNPVFAPTQAGSYHFVATATNEYGCAVTDTVVIQVKDIRCGPRHVTMCFYGQTVCIDRLAVPVMLWLRASLGDCVRSTARMAAVSPAAGFFKVYPVPASSTVTVQFALPVTGSYRVEIYNVHGQMVQRAASGKADAFQVLTVPVNSGRLGNGIYFVKLMTQKEIQVKTMVVQR